nr:uncharacterized protein LOC112028020 [Quercus suber]
MTSKAAKQKNPIQVLWTKPPQDWVKLNTDSSALGNPRKAGCGGLIRNHQGEWIRGFARGLGNTSSFVAELWALRDGLTMAKELGVNNLLVEMDALSVVLLLNNNTVNMVMEPLLTDCRNLLQSFPNKRVIHTFREANQCADVLARLGANFDPSFVGFENPPPVVASLLAFDLSDMYCNRLIFS